MSKKKVFKQFKQSAKDGEVTFQTSGHLQPQIRVAHMENVSHT